MLLNALRDSAVLLLITLCVLLQTIVLYMAIAVVKATIANVRRGRKSASFDSFEESIAREIARDERRRDQYKKR